MISNKLKAYLLYLPIFFILGVGAAMATSFTVGIEYSNAKPAVLVDDDGLTWSATNPLPTSGGMPTITAVTDGEMTVTTGGTPEALAASATPFVRCILTANQSNTDVMVIGSDTVDATLAGPRTGTPLVPFQSVTLKNADLADFYADVEVDGEGLSFHCEN